MNRAGDRRRPCALPSARPPLETAASALWLVLPVFISEPSVAQSQSRCCCLSFQPQAVSVESLLWKVRVVPWGWPVATSKHPLCAALSKCESSEVTLVA